MLILSILNFWSSDGVTCNGGQQPYLLYIGMINPFTYNFFNPVLQYYVCREEEHETQMLTVQLVFTGVHVALGVLMLYSVVLLEEKSFLKVFKPEMKEKRDEMVFVEDIESLKEREFKEMLMRASQ